jgi:PAS domain S-box-containing protein
LKIKQPRSICVSKRRRQPTQAIKILIRAELFKARQPKISRWQRFILTIGKNGKRGLGEQPGFLFFQSSFRTVPGEYQYPANKLSLVSRLLRPSTKLAFSTTADPVWARYGFAAAASAVALFLELWLNRTFTVPVTPFLPGFAAVIASAAWAGFGPGLFSTFTVSLWCAFFLNLEHRHTPIEQIVRLVIFISEGVLLSVGSGQLRRATHELTRSDDWHRRVVETSLEGIWVTDATGVVIYSNPRMAEILGTGIAAIEGKKTEDFFFPSDLSVERIRFQNRVSGQKEQFDRRLRRFDGSEAWVLVCSSPLFDAEKRFSGVLSMMTDITERKRAEHALRRSEERFRGLFENVLEGVYQSTPEGQIVAANPMLLRMLGLANESELNDVNIAKDLYVNPEVRKRLLERLERDGSFQNVEYELRRRNGSVLTVRENARTVRDEEGRVLYYEGTLSDITEIKNVEEQLVNAQKVEALGGLAAGIANDFSNILILISGQAQLILEDLPPSHAARPNAEQVIRTAESAMALTERLLSFSRNRTASAMLSPVDSEVGRSEDA